MEIHRSGYVGTEVAAPSANAQRHQLGGTGADARSARADAPGILLASHVASADPHTGYVLESLLDARGDLIAASAADTPAKLAVGANGTLLIADSTQTTGLRWTTLPCVRVNRSATQSISNNTITTLEWDTEMYDSHFMHSTVANLDRLTATLAGIHHIELNLEFQAHATGFRGIQIVHSADGVIAKHYLPDTGVAVTPIMHVSCDHDMAVGEYVYAQAWQTSGTSLLVGNQLWDTFSARWVRTSP